MMLSYPYGWITAVGLFFLLIFIAILSTPVIITGHFRRVESNNDDAEMNMKALFGLIKYRVKIPIIQFTGKSIELKEQVSHTNMGIDTWKQYSEEVNADKVISGIEKLKRFLEVTYHLSNWTKRTLKRVQLVEWKWTTSVGTGDAMWTAMTTGFIWSVKTTIIGLLSQMVKLENEPKMSVSPIYQRSEFTTEWSCIAQIRLGYAILAGLQLLVRKNKTKGDVKEWQNILFRA